MPETPIYHNSDPIINFFGKPQALPPV